MFGRTSERGGLRGRGTVVGAVFAAAGGVMALGMVGFVAAPAVVEVEKTEAELSPISAALLSVDEDVKVYNEHLTTLASPYMQGRVPGSIGMERAREYSSFHLELAGFEPAFPGEDGTPYSTWLDPFELGGTWEVTEEAVAVTSAEAVVALEADSDFVLTGLGGTGAASGRAVFVGYGIDNGPDGFNSYGELDDLSGHVAVMFRFEPVDREGNSRWTEGRGWSDRASFANKLRGAVERGAEGVIIINTPGTNDPRGSRLNRFSGGGGNADVPVFMMSPEGAEKMFAAAGQDQSLMQMRRMADRGREPMLLDAALVVKGEAEREPVVAENVGGVLRGTGELADEWIVVGAHLDHLGMGYFGSRSGPGELHPGADDNASGSAGVLLLADMLGRAVTSEDGDFAGGGEKGRRSVLLMLFDGEESGLWGSRHYVQDPIAPAEKHVLMMNWDMIGRISGGTASVSGMDTGVGMREYFAPMLKDAELEIDAPTRMSGASDHTSFYRAGIPVLFGFSGDLHADYHTPADTSDKINRVGATQLVRVFAEMVKAYAVEPEAFPLATEGGGQQTAMGGMSGVRVRFGVMPGSYTEDEAGIPIGDVTDGGSAALAGVLAGDRLIRWDGQKVEDVNEWMGLLAEHEPGDEIKIGVIRDGEELTLEVTLQER